MPLPRIDRRVVTVAASLGASQLLAGLVGVLSARFLGPEGKGVVTAVSTWPQLLIWFGLVGLNVAIGVRVAESSERDWGAALGNAVVHTLVAGILGTAIALVVLPPLLSHLGGDVRSAIYLGIPVIPLGIATELALAFHVGARNVRQVNLARLAAPVAMLAVTVGLAATDQLTAATAVLAITIGSALGLATALPGLPLRSAHPNFAQLRQDLRFGAKTAASGLLTLVNLRLDLVLMSALASATQVGFYGLANNLMIPVATVGAAAAAVLTPEIARRSAEALDSSSHQEIIAEIHRQARHYVALSTVGGIALVVAAPLLVTPILGNGFARTVDLIWVLVPGFVFRTYSTVVMSGAIGMRRTRVANISEGVGLVVTAGLLLLLLKPYGAMGAAIASVCAYAVTAVVANRVLHRLAPTPAVTEPSPVPAYDR